MKASQKRVLDAIIALPVDEFADLQFTTELTNLVAQRAHLARSSQRRIQVSAPRTPVVKTVPLRPGLTQLRPGKPVQVAVQTLAKKTVVKAPPLKMTVAQKEKVAAEWAVNNLRPGRDTIVKFKDTRDGHGIRKILLLDSRQNTFMCTRYELVRPENIGLYDVIVVNDPKSAGLQYYRELHTAATTTHQAGKVIATLDNSKSLNKSHRVTTIPPLLNT